MNSIKVVNHAPRTDRLSTGIDRQPTVEQDFCRKTSCVRKAKKILLGRQVEAMLIIMNDHLMFPLDILVLAVTYRTAPHNPARPV